ncbi:MAG: SGNH/GDSL hydrolase family protein, partial [Roseiarcus sp.]
EIRRVAPAAKIAVVSLPPFGPDFRLRDDDRTLFNASLMKMADVIVVGEPAHWAPRGTEAGCYQPDAVHFTRAGYERLTAATARALDNI